MPVLFAAGFLWFLLGFVYTREGHGHVVAKELRHNLLEFGELILFLLSAMTFINTMEERRVFDKVRSWLINKKFSVKGLFWITGVLAFIISPIADNLTTTLIVGAVVIAVGGNNKAFVSIACINIVVAANAGGAFSPFGDITTLMVWQKGHVAFLEFFALFFPSVINWLVPAIIMSFFIQPGMSTVPKENVRLKPGAITIIFLFLFTIIITVIGQNYLSLPPVIGMMLGLAILKCYSYLNKYLYAGVANSDMGDGELLAGFAYKKEKGEAIDTFRLLERVEWDTLMFFYGVILCVGALNVVGYLEIFSEAAYGSYGPTIANTIIGSISSIIDNIPVMFAVLSMSPDMSHEQWLLATLCLGVGGSLLSIGSAAGVALMGQAKGAYTFMSHLKWTWAIMLGYFASIIVHLAINGF